MSRAGIGLVRITLLFGSVAVALALILTPIMERRAREVAIDGIGVDRLATGSIDNGRGSVFAVRQRVLQPWPESVCIVDGNGGRSGAC